MDRKRVISDERTGKIKAQWEFAKLHFINTNERIAKEGGVCRRVRPSTVLTFYIGDHSDPNDSRSGSSILSRRSRTHRWLERRQDPWWDSKSGTVAAEGWQTGTRFHKHRGLLSPHHRMFPRNYRLDCQFYRSVGQRALERTNLVRPHLSGDRSLCRVQKSKNCGRSWKPPG